MQTGKTIVILGAARFDSRVASTSYTLANYLARRHRVYYVDYPYTWRDWIMYRKNQEFSRRKPYFKRSGSGCMETPNPNLKILIVPPVASINFIPEGTVYRLLLRLVEKTIRNRIRQVLKHDEIEDFIFINSFNFHYPKVSEGLFPKLTIYHCVDPLVVDYDLRHGRTSEEQLVRNSDVVICTSKQLFKEKARLNPNCYFVPNAADISHSAKALDKSVQVHSSLIAVRKPVIGYFGNIERRMDFELLQDVIHSNPDKSFVFAGPVSCDDIPEWFFTAPNIHLTGSIPYDEMPAVLKGLDVAMIPFKKDQVSATIFPLKLFEYLGAGRPVVATDFNPDLKEFTGDTVSYCTGAEAFSAAIGAALADNDPRRVAERVRVAEANTWDNRAHQFDQILEKNYPL